MKEISTPLKKQLILLNLYDFNILETIVSAEMKKKSLL